MPHLSDTHWIEARAQALGFDLCGIAPAQGLGELAYLNEWLERGYAGEMAYLHDERRTDPQRVLPGAKSIIVCALNYNTSRPDSVEAVADTARHSEARGWISNYAWGDDYHKLLGDKLEQFVAALRERFGNDFAARAYVDTGPIAERVAALHAGLGWLAKNTCLINEQLGSRFFLGVVVTSLDFTADFTGSANEARTPAPDLCGNCRLCLDACPTGALVEPYVMDARRCIAYLTIELRGTIPEEFRTDMGWQVFGCDICQDVCPWNRTAPATSLAALEPRPKLFAPELAWLLSLEEEEFRRVFRGSPVRRTKLRGLLRNACIAAGNAGGDGACSAVEKARLRERLTHLAESSDALVAEHARWALARFSDAGQ